MKSPLLLVAALVLSAGTTPVAAAGVPSGRTTYRQLADYTNDIAGLAAAYPSAARAFVLARPSLEGRQVHALEISHNVADSASKPVFLLMGVHHAREWPSGEASMEFAFDLLRNDGTDPRITALLDRVRVIVVPVVNPDGFHISRQYIYEMKRKNCRIRDGQVPAPGECSQPANFQLGVDLNRNYGYGWTADPDRTSEVYPGAGPFTEPEDQNIRDLVSSRQVTVLLSNHTYGNVVLRPSSSDDAYRQLGDQLAAQSGYSSSALGAGGLTDGWSYYATGGYGFTPELTPNEFHGPYANAVIAEYNGIGGRAGWRGMFLVAAEAAADRVRHSVLTGAAPPGTRLRIVKDFTLAGQATHLESALTVPSTGRFTWDVNPSARPTSSGTLDERWTVSCDTYSASVLVRRGQQANVDMSACGPAVVVFADDFSADRGWTVSGTATAGQFERAVPSPTSYNSVPYQLSGSSSLVTGPLAGTDAGNYDLDGGVTTVTSPLITLPASATLSLRYYLAHADNSTSDDYFRVRVNGTTVFSQTGAATFRGAAWATPSVSLSGFAGQQVRIVVEAADLGTGSLLEAAVDDVLITAPVVNPSAFADDFSADRGWTVSGTATTGAWARGVPAETSFSGTICQTSNGSPALVTGLGGGDCALSDVDGGVTAATSPSFTVPTSGSLTFDYYLAHLNNATAADYLRLRIGSTVVWQRMGSASNVSAVWGPATVDLSAYAGQTVQLVFEASDLDTPGMIEAAVDNVVVR